MSQPSVLYESDGSVALITINRPERRNALNRETAIALSDAWQRFEAESARVAIVTGAGTAAFSSGADLDDPPDAGICIPGAGVEVRKPVIAAISGWAVGFGVTLAMTADLAVAARGARFMYPESKVGYTAGMIASLAVRVSFKHAMEILLVGDEFDSQRAWEIGLVNWVVDDGAHLEEAMRLAHKIASRAPLVTTELKRLAVETLPRSNAEISAGFQARMARIARSQDRAEGQAAMAAKRLPEFNGR